MKIKPLPHTTKANTIISGNARRAYDILHRIAYGLDFDNPVEAAKGFIDELRDKYEGPLCK